MYSLFTGSWIPSAKNAGSPVPTLAGLKLATLAGRILERMFGRNFQGRDAMKREDDDGRAWWA
jgi:hypothetical protein